MSEAFFANVEKGGSCWLWTGPKTRGGYGIASVAGKLRQAHRLSYEIAHGELPPKTLVLHSCDNPPCVNPAHLRPGTHAENMADARARPRAGLPRGRYSRNGARLPLSSLPHSMSWKAGGGAGAAHTAQFRHPRPVVAVGPRATHEPALSVPSQTEEI